jgi:SAM-dependent methyltransferase
MIREAAQDRTRGRVLDDGCGVGAYLEHLAAEARLAVGVESDRDRARDAGRRGLCVVCATCEALPFASGVFDLVVSHEVLEHVRDDRATAREASRVLAPSVGRLILFVPNRGYPFETHGIYWRGRYRFGNIPLVNYLPAPWRNRLAPHVRAYTARSLSRLLDGLPLRLIRRALLFGAYDNIIARWPLLGKALRALLQALEQTPLRVLGLSHFWVLERI